MPNRLLHEKSPYLLQHANNPVDWYPWGDEAFERARAEDRPIFLSIGYSTCHWCHVMEHESFESQRVADILNSHYVSIKVDREERPDVDRVYMHALQSMGQQGGWPMSMFLTPALRPFFGGTYFPPESRYGRPGFAELLLRIYEAWSTDRTRIEASADGLIRHLASFVPAPAGGKLPGPELFAAGLDAYARSFDTVHGGFGDAPKFPRPAVFSFLLRASQRTGRTEGTAMTRQSLLAMADGGIHDHLGGGFHRYAVDSAWHVPHFEKMLYDQAQIAAALLECMQCTGERVFGDLAQEILTYVAREMTDAEGGFFSAEDADSPKPDAPDERGEGAFYLWSRDEIIRRLGEDAGNLFCLRYGVQAEGNVAHDPHGEFGVMNILHAVMTPEDVAHATGRPPGEATAVQENARRTLLGVRSGRPRPFRDDKVLTGWNGLMISACARTGRVLEDPAWSAQGARAAVFVLDRLRDAETGRLFRRWRSGEARHPGHLDDYAFLVQGLLDLYESSFDVRWLREALALAGMMMADFNNDAGGGLMDTAGGDPSVLIRTADLYDGAEPSGQSVAALDLLRLAHLTGEAKFRVRAEAILASAAPVLLRQPELAPAMGTALDFALGPVQEIVIVGGREEAGVQKMLRDVARRFLPRAVVMLKEDDGEALGAIAPFTVPLVRVNGLPAAYVCRDHTCSLPVTSSADLARLLDDRP